MLQSMGLLRVGNNGVAEQQLIIRAHRTILLFKMTVEHIFTTAVFGWLWAFYKL